jgi:hypothetical protein
VTNPKVWVIAIHGDWPSASHPDPAVPGRSRSIHPYGTLCGRAFVSYRRRTFFPGAPAQGSGRMPVRSGHPAVLGSAAEACGAAPVATSISIVAWITIQAR